MTTCPACRADTHEILKYEKQEQYTYRLVVKCISCEHVWGFMVGDDG